jgi:DNA-binding MarR family transcriptional regulator
MGADAAANSEPKLDEQVRALVRAARVARQRLTVRGVQVQPGTVGILTVIGSTGEAGGCHPKELAARCALDASTISRAVATLVARGLVERSADPADRRACILTLTAAGHDALADLHRRQSEFLSEALREWSASELDAFAAGLARFVDDLTTYLDRTSLDRTSTTPAAPAGVSEPSEDQKPMLEAAL